MTDTVRDDIRCPAPQHLAETVGRISRELCALTHEAGLYRLACLLHEVQVEARYAVELERELALN